MKPKIHESIFLGEKSAITLNPNNPIFCPSTDIPLRVITAQYNELAFQAHNRVCNSKEILSKLELAIRVH
jgi:hypothetical protein